MNSLAQSLSLSERLYFLSHRVGRVLTDDVMTVIQQRYTLSQKGQNSLLTVHSFVYCCCRIECMLGELTFVRKKNLRRLTNTLVKSPLN